MISTVGRLKFAGFLLLTAMAVTLAYTTLHEGGHALAGLAFGGRITEFNVNFFNLLHAHVSIAGEYRIVLTSRKSPGILKVYIRTP